jgi:hypothetical protein
LTSPRTGRSLPVHLRGAAGPPTPLLRFFSARRESGSGCSFALQHSCHANERSAAAASYLPSGPALVKTWLHCNIRPTGAPDSPPAGPRRREVFGEQSPPSEGPARHNDQRQETL